MQNRGTARASCSFKAGIGKVVLKYQYLCFRRRGSSNHRLTENPASCFYNISVLNSRIRDPINRNFIKLASELNSWIVY